MTKPANLPTSSPVTVAIMAGGQSMRMGRDKSLLCLGGQPLIERVLDRVAPLSDDLLIVTNDPEKYGWLANRARFIPDATGPGRGPLAGIAAALAAARAPASLVVATDMPFLSAPLLHHLATLDAEADVVVPVIEAGRPETLHALYRRTCLPAIERRLAAGRLKITGFFEEVRVREVGVAELRRFDPELRSFVNANTPAEWVAASAQEANDGMD